MEYFECATAVPRYGLKTAEHIGKTIFNHLAYQLGRSGALDGLVKRDHQNMMRELRIFHCQPDEPMQPSPEASAVQRFAEIHGPQTVAELHYINDHLEDTDPFAESQLMNILFEEQIKRRPDKSS